MNRQAPRPGAVGEHYVASAPFDAGSIEVLTAEQEDYYLASQWRLMWWKLKRHRVAVVSAFILLTMYASGLVSEFLAPYDLHTRATDFI